jgi:pantetheine-phosphate adenylyltransferase
VSRVVYPGSFDPVTNGHVDIIKRASRLFDHIVVAVLVNGEKQVVFTMEERVELLKKSCAGIKNVEIDMFSGLLIDYVKSKGADTIVKGLRAVSDYEYEMQMALLNKHIDNEIETIFLMADLQNSFLSSSAIRDLARNKADISSLVPECVVEDIKRKF